MAAEEYRKIQNHSSRAWHIVEIEPCTAGPTCTADHYRPLCGRRSSITTKRSPVTDFDPDHDLDLNICVRCRDRWENRLVNDFRKMLTQV